MGCIAGVSVLMPSQIRLMVKRFRAFFTLVWFVVCNVALDVSMKTHKVCEPFSTLFTTEKSLLRMQYLVMVLKTNFANELLIALFTAPFGNGFNYRGRVSFSVKW